MPCTKCEEGKYKWGKTGSCKYDTKEACEEDNKDYYEKMKTTSIVELVIDEDSQELAIDAISLVSAPAIEQDFVFFGKEKNNLTFAKVDEEKRMLVSPALIPDKQIFRYDANTDSDYYVYFSKDTVRKASELYLKNNNHHKATEEHSERVSGVLTVESWIIEDPKNDKSNLYGFSLPKGTWMVKMKIENEDLWQKIKAGELKGLSIEGYFTNKFEQMQKTKPTTEEILSALNELVREGRITTMSKAKRLELGLGDESKKLISKLTSSAKDTNTELDKAFTPIRQLEKSIKSLRAEIPSKIAKFNSFEKDLQNLETQYNKDNDTLNKAEKELGIKIPRPKIFDTIVKALEKYQKEEEIFRKEINEFNKLSSTIKKIKI